MTFLVIYIKTSIYTANSRLQLGLQLQNLPFSTAISILQLQKIGKTSRACFKKNSPLHISSAEAGVWS